MNKNMEKDNNTVNAIIHLIENSDDVGKTFNWAITIPDAAFIQKVHKIVQVMNANRLSWSTPNEELAMELDCTYWLVLKADNPLASVLMDAYERTHNNKNYKNIGMWRETEEGTGLPIIRVSYKKIYDLV